MSSRGRVGASASRIRRLHATLDAAAGPGAAELEAAGERMLLVLSAEIATSMGKQLTAVEAAALADVDQQSADADLYRRRDEARGETPIDEMTDDELARVAGPETIAALDAIVDEVLQRPDDTEVPA